MYMRDQHPRSVQILGLATLKRDPNALTDLTAIRSINPRFEKKIDNYNKPIFKILLSNDTSYIPKCQKTFSLSLKHPNLKKLFKIR